MEYSIILPAFNEAETLETAIKTTLSVFNDLQKPFEIIIVNDGSTDQTLAIAKQLAHDYSAVHYVSLEKNQGKGAAIKAGVAQATGRFTLFLDSDLATHPSAFLAFIPELTSYPIVIGSRKMAGAAIEVAQPWYRHVFGNTFNAIIRYGLKLPYNDTQCGFKAFQTPVAKELFQELTTSGWVFDVELLLKAKQQDYLVKELPIVWRNGKTSRVKLTDAKNIVLDLLRLRRTYHAR